MDEELQVLPSADGRFVRVRRPDGAEFDLPRDSAVAMGLVSPVPPMAADNPLVQQIQPADLGPMLRQGQAADVIGQAEPSVDDFVAGLAAQPQTPAPPPAAPAVPNLGLQGADAQAAAALLTPQGQAQAGVAPPAPSHAVGPGVPQEVLASPYRPMGEVLTAPTNAARPGETFTPVVQPQQPAAAPADAPMPGMRRRAAPAPAQPPDLIDQLTQRPMDAPPLAPQDFRGLSPLEQQQQMIAEGERLAREGAANEARAHMERADILRQGQADMAQLERERRETMARISQRYDAAIEEARNARVDPNRFFASRGVAGTIGVAIASALGGFGAAMTGGANTAVDVINRAIDRDIAAQEANQRNAQAHVGNVRSLFDIARQEFSDRAAAQQAARGLAWGQVAERAGAQAASLRDQGARLRAQELQQQAEAQAAQARSAAEQAQFEAEMSRRRTIAEVTTAEAGAMRAMRRAQGGGGRAARPATQAQLQVYDNLVARNPNADRAELARAAGLSFVPGDAGAGGGARPEQVIPGATFTGEAQPSEQQINEAREYVGAIGSTLELIDQAIALRERVGFEVMDRDAVAQASALQSGIITGMRTIEQTGVPQEGEMRDFRRRVPDATSFAMSFPGQADPVLSQLRALRAQLLTSANANLRPRGYRYGSAPHQQEQQPEAQPLPAGVRQR